MTAIRLRTVIEKTGPAAAILLDDEQVVAIGSAKNPPVVATLGDRSARLRIARMGGRNMLGLSTPAIRAAGQG
ncbi:hypothetical protein GCM10022219_11950 [Microbacterium oryzae]|uniref:DUF1905 domain-containing protein n=1 Tax=Microbacterium oryzae TaxID=743009 RepID=A0A6I6DU24_9MICO|nr:DUF1905 domain-containing protein [Microbacterium oryzae]QGU28442.1 DUF1905 domain-containing protein [Microbacterium oryzae]